MITVKRRIATVIHEKRRAKGLTQEQLAKKLGFLPATLGRSSAE